jgi:MFS family permease
VVVRRVFLAGQVISLVGDGLAILAVPLLVLQLTHDPLLAGVAAAMRSVGYLAVGVPAGPLVDRFSATAVLITADVVRCGSFLLLGLLAAQPAPPLWLIMLLAFASACATVFYDAALAVTVQDLFARGRVVAANSIIETATQLARVIGPPAAGLLAVGAGLAGALWIDAATFAVSLATVCMIARAGATPASRADSAVRGLRGVARSFVEGFAYLRAQRLIFTLTLLFAITNLCLGVDTLLVYYGRITLHLSATQISVVVAAGGLAGVLGALLAPRVDLRLSRVAFVTALIAAAGAAVAVMAVTTGMWSLAAANAALIFATSQAGLLVRGIRQELVPRAMLGRVTATVRTVFVSATPLGSLIGGTATRGAHGDPRPAFSVAGIMLMCVTGAAWARTLRHQASRWPASGGSARSSPRTTRRVVAKSFRCAA